MLGKIRSWYWFSEYGLMVYSMLRNRFCERIGRQHKSNHGKSEKFFALFSADKITSTKQVFQSCCFPHPWFKFINSLRCLYARVDLGLGANLEFENYCLQISVLNSNRLSKFRLHYMVNFRWNVLYLWMMKVWLH